MEGGGWRDDEREGRGEGRGGEDSTGTQVQGHAVVQSLQGSRGGKPDIPSSILPNLPHYRPYPNSHSCKTLQLCATPAPPHPLHTPPPSLHPRSTHRANGVEKRVSCMLSQSLHLVRIKTQTRLRLRLDCGPDTSMSSLDAMHCFEELCYSWNPLGLLVHLIPIAVRCIAQSFRQLTDHPEECRAFLGKLPRPKVFRDSQGRPRHFSQDATRRAL